MSREREDDLLEIGGAPRGEFEPPERTSPSPWLYRGSLVALVVGSFVALFLVLRPPESKSNQEIVRDVATNTPAIQQTATATPPAGTPQPGTAVAATPTPFDATPAPADATPATATPTAEPGAPIEYTIEPGDTLFDIALEHDTTVDAILELNPGLDPDLINPGDVILIPSSP